MCDVLLDVGGTGIKGAAVENGALPSEYREFPARSGEPGDVLLAHFAGIIADLAAGRPIGTVAMAFPGPFDYAEGIPMMRGLAKYESLYGRALPALLEERSIRPERWYFINDVSAYALGVVSEMQLAGRVMCVCLGTGAGSAFVRDGSLTEDASLGVPEHGWIYSLPYLDATIDDYLSDRGIRRLSREILGREESPRVLHGLSVQGDEAAAEVWRSFGLHAEAALRGVIRRFRPDVLVLGGKITNAAAWFEAPLVALCEAKGVRLVKAPDTTRFVLSGLKGQICNEAGEK